MPWSNQSGGGNGGPWKPNKNSPWGQGSGGNNGSGGSGGSGGPTPPDLEELLRRSQDRLKQILPGGFTSGFGLAIAVLVAAGIWLLMGFYTVQPNEVGLNMVFGKYSSKTGAGLRYNWPYPIGRVVKLPVTDRKSIDIGFRSRDARTGSSQLNVPEESLMVTGDENIADLKFRVIWQINPARAEDYAFNVRAPANTVKVVSESVMREIVGRNLINNILNEGRRSIEPQARTQIQKVLDEYKAGATILQVQLLSIDPPEQVIAAFRDVTAAQQDQERLSNEAQAYANRVVPEARGAAARILQEAEGYRQQTIAEAKGAVSRFNQIYAQYAKAPYVTRQRLYLETMERVFSSTGKIILDKNAGGGQGVVPYLPLGELRGAAKTGAK